MITFIFMCCPQSSIIIIFLSHYCPPYNYCNPPTHTHSQAFLNSQMKGKKTGAAVEAPKVTEIPPELLCHLCKELVRDAVIIPCCGESFCYECIQDHLCENEFTCPMCKASDVSPERLAPNKALRTVSS